MSLSLLLYRLGRWAVRRRRLVVAVWVVGALASFATGRVLGTGFTDDWRVPGTEAQRAHDLLVERFPAASGTDATVVFHAAEGDLLDPSAGAVVSGALDEVAGLPHVLGVERPGVPGSRAGVSQDGGTAFATVHYDLDAAALGEPAIERLNAAVEPARGAGLQVELGGPLVEGGQEREPGGSEAIGLGVAVVVLLFAFGSVVAMGLPIVTALLGLLAGMSVVMLVALAIDMPTVAPTLAAMIGLGVGIDYALFIVTRHRQQLAQRHTVEDAAGRAMATAGQAVLFAGATVIVAILGLWIAGIPFVGLLGTAAAVVVAVAVLAALTLLPALLGFAGRSIDRFRVPGMRPRGEDAHARGWARWGHHVGTKPWRHLVLSTVILSLLAAPMFSMRLGQVDAGTAPTDTTQRRAYDLMTAAFGPGSNGPLVLTVELATPSDTAALEAISGTLQADRDVVGVRPAVLSPDGRTAVITAVPRSAPQDEATTDLVHRLRDRTLPAAVEGTGARVHVGGQTATYIDLADKVAGALPVFIGAVIALSFVLLMLVFRSVLVPLKAALMNVLSIGAAYGVVVAIFQWGWGNGLVGLEEPVPIVSFVPMMMFAILFGLSMDYEVFLLSRIREEYLRDGDDLQSVVDGLAHTARVITSAALIMIAVFLSFLLNDDPTVKMVGVGLATAVAVDATIVRIMLVPSTMVLLGRANWWLPAWLDRILPSLDVEGEAGLPPAELEPEPVRVPEAVAV
ncbi:MAG TPA: MMPL family transporter [Actinomycetota bacterium]